MHSITLAPVLSAIRSRLSCWIILDSSFTGTPDIPWECRATATKKAGQVWRVMVCSVSKSGNALGALKDLDDAPTLLAAQRP
jgi:hypothetical protein